MAGITELADIPSNERTVKKSIIIMEAKNIEKKTLKKHKIASILIVGVIILKLILDLLPETAFMTFGFSNSIFNYIIIAVPYIILIMFLIFIYKEYSWIKYGMIILTIPIILAMPELIKELKNPTRTIIIELIQCILIISTQIILFAKKKSE